MLDIDKNCRKFTAEVISRWNSISRVSTSCFRSVKPFEGIVYIC